MNFSASMAQPNSIPKTEASRALEEETLEFLRNGGSISEVKKNGEIVRVKSNIKPYVSEKKKNMDAARKSLVDAKFSRLATQQPIIREYDEKVNIKEKWTYLVKRSETSVTSIALHGVLRGEGTIRDDEVFNIIKKTIYDVISEFELFKSKYADELLELKNKGVSTFEKQKRIIEQRPLIKLYVEKFNDDFTLTKLEKLNNKEISSRHLRNLRDGTSTVSSMEKWKRLKNTIEGLINE